MAAFSDYTEDQLVNLLLRGIPFTSPATIYVGLHLSSPTDANIGIEVIGGSYSRQAISFDPPSSGVTLNSSVVVFPTATASWGTVTHFGLYDSSGAGNLLMWGALSNPIVLDSGDSFTIPAGTLSVSMD